MIGKTSISFKMCQGKMQTFLSTASWHVDRRPLGGVDLRTVSSPETSLGDARREQGPHLLSGTRFYPISRSWSFFVHIILCLVPKIGSSDKHTKACMPAWPLARLCTNLSSRITLGKRRQKRREGRLECKMEQCGGVSTQVQGAACLEVQQ